MIPSICLWKCWESQLMIANIFQNVGIPNIFNKLLKMFPAYELRSTIYTMEIILTNNKGVFSLEVVWLLVYLNYNGKFVGVLLRKKDKCSAQTSVLWEFSCEIQSFPHNQNLTGWNNGHNPNRRDIFKLIDRGWNVIWLCGWNWRGLFIDSGLTGNAFKGLEGEIVNQAGKAGRGWWQVR